MWSLSALFVLAICSLLGPWSPLRRKNGPKGKNSSRDSN